MPYNEFGEYIPDELALDAMKYELAKKGVMPLRPGGSDVPYVASEIPQTYVAKPPPAPASTAKNVPQAIADRLGLSAIPQAALGMVSSFPAAVAKEMGFPKVAEAIQYTPTSKMGQEVLEGVSRLPQVLTGSEMGVGPLAEFYVPRRAFGLERRPFISPDDVRVMGSRAIETGRELRNIPEDFRAAQEGLRRESVFGGQTVGARAQGVAENIGDIMARRQMQGLSPIPGIPDIVPDTKLYAVRPPNVGQMIDPIDLPTARYADENRRVHTVQNILGEKTPYIDADFPHNTKSEYYNAAVRDAPTEVLDAWKSFSQKKIEEMFPDAPAPSAAVEAYQTKFNQKEFALHQMNMLSEFAQSPEALSAVQSVADRRDELINEYNKEKNKPKKDLKTDEDRRAHQEKVDQMELELLQKDLMPELSRDEFIKRITPPTQEEYMRRAKAAKEYLEGTFKKDISKYIGTSQGPQMELAKRGVTLAPKEELLEYAKKVESGRNAFRGEFAELQKARAKAGFNPKGEMFPLIEKKEAEVKDLQTKLNELNRQKSELRDLHRVELPDEPDPARNPGETGAKYRALTNPMNALIDKIEQNKKQLENFKLANAYELISDVAYTPVTAKFLKEQIPYAEKQFFPNLAKTPDEAQMFNVKSRELGELGVPLLAEMIAKDILSGRIPLDETKPSALPKSKYKEDLSNFPEEDILDYAKAVRESKAAPRAKEEAEAAVLSGISNKFIVYEGKRIAGAASYDIDESTKTVFIDHLGSLIKGTGKQMVQEIENAVQPGYRVVLTSSDQAKKFWDKLGYKPTGEGSLLEKRIEEPSQKVSKVNVQIDKIIEQLTKPRLKEESIKEAESRKGMIQLNDFAQESLSKIPANLRFKNASVLELTKDSTESAIRRQISFDGMVLDHCIAGCDAPHPGINPFSGERYDYSYPVDPATGKDRGGRKLLSGYMKRVKEGDERTSHLRDNVTGLPVVTINMHRNDNGTYRLGYVSGYKNKADKPQYAEDIKDYLNARSDIITGSGDALQKWGIFDMMKNRDLSTVASMLNVPATESSITNLGIPRFVLESDIRNLALQQPVGDTHADLVRRRAQLNDEYNRIVRDRGEDDPEAVDIADDIQDLTARLETYSRQVTTQGGPNTFRRMTSRQLEDVLDQQGGRGEVLAIYDNLITDDTYGIRDFWADDFDFYPERLRTFTNAVRNRQELVQAMTAGQEGYDAAMRESLIRFQDAIRNFNTQQRELLVRSLDDHAEVNIASQIDTLNPDDPEESQRQYENAHPEVPDYLEEISRRRRGEDFTPIEQQERNQLPPEEIRERSINFLANEIVPGNAAFREQAIEEISGAIRDEILPIIERLDPNDAADRRTLERELRFLETNPFDRDLGQRLETYIQNNSARENDIRGRVVDFMTDKIQRRLGQAPAPIEAPEEPLIPEWVRGSITREMNELMELGQLEQTASILNRILRREGYFSNLDDETIRNAADFTNSLLRQLINDPNYRPAAPAIAAPQTVLNRPQIEDVINREVDRQSNILNLTPVNQDLFRHDMNAILENRSPDQMITELEELHTRYQNERQDGLARAVSSVLNELAHMSNAARRAPQLPAPAIADDRSIGTYRQRFTNELTGSRRAFDEVMQAERMTPGAINEAIRRTDGDARYNQDVMDFYRVNSPSGIAQLNNALRRYMEGNGFDIEAPAPARPVANQEALGDILNEALETTANNYADNIVDTIQRDLDGLMTENIRFERNPRDFISRLNMLSNEARETGLEGDAVYATAIDELVTALNYGLEQIAAPVVNPIDELERRYGQERAPIDIVTDGLNLPIPQFQRDYSENVQREYREILSEIEPAVSETNLQNAMHHLSVMHDIVLSQDREPAEFGLTSEQEKNQLADLLDRHFEVFRQFENLLDDADREPPEGRKRGGFIKKMNNGGKADETERTNIPNIEYQENKEPFNMPFGFTAKHDKFGNIDVTSGRVYHHVNTDDGRLTIGASGARTVGPQGSNTRITNVDAAYSKKVGPGMLTGSVSKPIHGKNNRYGINYVLPFNTGGRVNPVPTAARIESEAPKLPHIKPMVNPADPGFAEKLKYEIEQRQKAAARTSGGGGNLTDTELKNRLGSRNPTYNAGGKVSIDQMRYELLRKR